MTKPIPVRVLIAVCLLIASVAASLAYQRPAVEVRRVVAQPEVREVRSTAPQAVRVAPKPVVVAPVAKKAPVEAPRAAKAAPARIMQAVAACSGRTAADCRQALLEPIVRAEWLRRSKVDGISASQAQQSADTIVRLVDNCENPGWNPRAVSATSDHGMTQINARTWRDDWPSWNLGPWEPNVYDPVLNTSGAYNIFADAGHSFGPWSCW